MTSLIRFTVALLIVIAAGASFRAQEASPARVAQAQPPQQEEFIPIDQLPAQEQLPAAPLLIGAYAFVLVMLFAYVVSVSRRLTAIQREMDRLDSDVKRASRT